MRGGASLVEPLLGDDRDRTAQQQWTPPADDCNEDNMDTQQHLMELAQRFQVSTQHQQQQQHPSTDEPAAFELS